MQTTKKQSLKGFKDPSATDYTDAYKQLPAYYRLQKSIEQEIINGEKKPGELIPSEREYAEIYGISIGTVRKGLGKLVQDGFIERSRGKGSFVRSRAIQNEALRYYRYVENFNSNHESLSIKSLGTTNVIGDSNVCKALRIKSKSRLTCLKRIFSLNDNPMVYSVSYFSNSLFPGIATLPPEVFEKQTLYMTVEKLFGLPTKEVKEYFSAVAVDSETAEYLSICQGTPVLCIHMLAISFKDVIYEYRQSYCNTETYYLLRDRGLF